MAALPALQLPNTRLPGPLRPAKSFTVLSTTQEEPSWAPPLLPPHEDDSCRAQGREPHAFSKQVANESHFCGRTYGPASGGCTFSSLARHFPPTTQCTSAAFLLMPARMRGHWSVVITQCRREELSKAVWDQHHEVCASSVVLSVGRPLPGPRWTHPEEARY